MWWPLGGGFGGINYIGEKNITLLLVFDVFSVSMFYCCDSVDNYDNYEIYLLDS